MLRFPEQRLRRLQGLDFDFNELTDNLERQKLVGNWNGYKAMLSPRLHCHCLSTGGQLRRVPEQAGSGVPAVPPPCSSSL